MQIVLFEPEIPPNTGNIARLCAATDTTLNLIEPLGFKLEDRYLKRAGLDYWDKLKLSVYPNLEAFYAQNPGGDFYYFSTKASRRYTQVRYQEQSYLIFGKETKGLPEEIVYGNPERAVRIPMREGLRSLNLANSVAIAAYEAARQMDFPELK